MNEKVPEFDPKLVMKKNPSGIKHSNTMLNTVPKEPASPMKTSKSPKRISQGDIKTKKIQEGEPKKKDNLNLAVATDQTSSLRLGDDISSINSPGLPKLKFGI